MDKPMAFPLRLNLLPEAPASIDADRMSDAAIHEKLRRGLEDARKGRTHDAERAFESFRKQL